MTVKYVFFGAFLHFYCDRTVFRLEVKWERERGNEIGKGPQYRTRTLDTGSATALYVGTLPTSLLAPTYLMSVEFVTILSYSEVNFK